MTCALRNKKKRLFIRMETGQFAKMSMFYKKKKNELIHRFQRKFQIHLPGIFKKNPKKLKFVSSNFFALTPGATDDGVGGCNW